MRYILNSAVITTPGTYDYRLITIDEAREWFNESLSISTIGYQETADALTVMIGHKILVNRKSIRMESGDEALVFRLTSRMNDPNMKGNIHNMDWLLKNSEIGILKKN